MAKPLERLARDLEEEAFEMVLQGKKMQDIARAMGLKSVSSLQRYLIKFPEFHEMYERAREAECYLIEEEYRHIVDNYNPDYGKIHAEVLRRLLMWRNPKRYGERQQIDMSVSIDISGSLDRAQKRLQDVTFSNVVQIGQAKKKEDEDE